MPRLVPRASGRCRRARLLFVLGALVVAGGLAAQEESPLTEDLSPTVPGSGGPSTLRGTAVDGGGEPVAGALVTLENPQDGGARLQASADERGRWSFARVPPGLWSIRVEATGYQPSEGRVRVGQRGTAEPLEVELRALDLTSPAFVEGDPRGTVRGWLEHGNGLLEQGQTEAARGEYEKTLRYVEGEERASVLRAIARTHYLEGAPEKAVSALEQALLAVPGSGETSALYRTLMGQLGRQREADRFFAELPQRAARDAERSAADAERRAPPPAPEPEPLVAHRIGLQTVRAQRRHPLSTAAEIARRYGVSAQDLERNEPSALAYSLDEESFDLFVPESYRQDTPFGVVVWISPTDRGGARGPEVQAVLAERRLLWVGANRSGNHRSLWDRAGLALDALQLVLDAYTVDPSRVYVAGYSGGGRMASHLAFLFPELFRGGIFWFGVDTYLRVPVPFSPGHTWADAFPAPHGKQLRELREEHRFALVTGDRDFNRSETRATYKALLADGYRGLDLLEIPNADHYHGVDGEWLGRALDAMEAEPPRR